MAVCPYCDREMLAADGCTLEVYDDFTDGVARQRIRYGDELGRWLDFDPPDPCHDCGAHLGELHHPRCDVEECPRCGGQAFSCDCVVPDPDARNMPAQRGETREETLAALAAYWNQPLTGDALEGVRDGGMPEGGS